MSEPLKVDSHIHVYRNAAEARIDKESYEVWEYGESDRVKYSDRTGTVEDTIDAMSVAGIDKAIVLNLFVADWIRQTALKSLPENAGESAREKILQDCNARMPEELTAFNRWACELARTHPQLVPFVGIDPGVLPGQAGAEHVREMVEQGGARGVKLHGPMQGFHVSDDRLWPMYEACQEMGAAIIAHSGPDKRGLGFAEPRTFERVLAAFPQLRVVVAHLGGGTWQQARDLASAYGNCFFDCCEIIEWAGGTRAPSQRELAQLILDIGPDRVMMGSDFPWYDFDHTVDRVMDLPMLSREQKEGILGRNAERILSL